MNISNRNRNQSSSSVSRLSQQQVQKPGALSSVQMSPQDSDQSDASSQRSTFSAAANFFSAHRPHVHGGGADDRAGVDPAGVSSKEKGSKRLFSTSSGAGQAAQQDVNTHHHHVPHHVPHHATHHGTHHGTHHHFKPFGGILTKSATSLHEPSPAPDDAPQATAQGTRASFFRALKRPATTVATPTNDSTLSLSSRSSLEDPMGPAAEHVPPNSKAASPGVFSGTPPPSSTSQLHKLAREKLTNQYVLFTKYQANKKRSDPIDYAPLRLESMHEFLQEVFDGAVRRVQASSDTGSRLAPLSEISTLTESSVVSSAGASALEIPPGGSDHVSDAGSNVDSAASAAAMLAGASQLSIEKQRACLMQLWLNAAWKLLIRSPSPIVAQIRAKPHRHPRTHAICYLQNQNTMLNPSTNEIRGFEETELSWINSWVVAYDEPDSMVNTVFLNKTELTPRIVMDRGSCGDQSIPQLSDDVTYLRHSPIVAIAEQDHLRFLPNYSLFTTNDYRRLPLCSGSQDVIYCHDLHVSLKHDEWAAAFQEFYRVLAPGGSVQFVIQDFELYSVHGDDGDDDGGTVSISRDQTALQKLWAMISGGAAAQDFELRPSRHVTGWLAEAGYRDIKYTLITIPKTVVPLKALQRSGANINGRSDSDATATESLAEQRKASVVSSTSAISTSSAENSRDSSKTSMDLLAGGSMADSLSVPKQQSPARPQHKTSYYRDERLNNFTSLVTGLTEYSYLNNFTNIHRSSPDDPEETARTKDDTLLEYIRYRNQGDGSGRVFYDEGYSLFMVVTAEKPILVE